jgi:hypothetical protein
VVVAPVDNGSDVGKILNGGTPMPGLSVGHKPVILTTLVLLTLPGTVNGVVTASCSILFTFNVNMSKHDLISFIPSIHAVHNNFCKVTDRVMDGIAFLWTGVTGSCEIHTQGSAVSDCGACYCVFRIHCKFWCLQLSTLDLGKTPHVSAVPVL